MPKGDDLGALGDISKLASGVALEGAAADALAGFDLAKLTADTAGAEELAAQFAAGTADAATTEAVAGETAATEAKE